MSASRSRDKNPQTPDSDQSPQPGYGANSSSTVGSIEASPGLGFQSTLVPSSSSEPPPRRRSLRIAAALSNAQSPLPAMHASSASASPSAEASLELGFQANSAPPPRPRLSLVQSLSPRISTGGVVGKIGGKVSPVAMSDSGGSKRKRGRPPKGIRIGENNGDESVIRRCPAQPERTDITKEVLEVEEEHEEEARGGDNSANSNGSATVNFADSHSGGVKITGEEEVVNFRSARRSIDKQKGKQIVDEELPGGAKGATSARDKLSYKGKGKGKLIENVDSEPDKISDSDSDELRELVKDAVTFLSLSLASQVKMQPPPEEMPDRPPTPRRVAQRNKAVELAPGFARCTNEKGEESAKDDEPFPDEPGPFTAAMKIIKERAVTFRDGKADSSKGNNSAGIKISWAPSTEGKNGLSGTKMPSLRELSVKALAENIEAIESLMGIPYAMRSQLSFVLCQTRKMNMNHLAKLMEGNLMELRLSDCSWASEENFEDAFKNCDKSNLEVLQLDRCGGCMPDYIMCSTLAHGPNSLPSLTKLSLKGAYSLSDKGLAAIVSSAPLLNSLNLSQCCLLTSEGILNVIDKQALLLKELYIDECQKVSAMSILPSLKKVKCLVVLSMGGIPSVSNEFVHELIPVCGSTIWELNFADCNQLTSSAIKVIGENCPHLTALDIRNLTQLKDSAIAHLANGCGAIQKLQLCKSSFSDEVIAAFVEALGAKLVELSLNKVTKVGNQTAIAISEQCRFHLKKLDLSFCRNMSDNALGLIVDSCSSLKTLKLFGCTQVTDLFLNGHSNTKVKILGACGNILDHIEIPHFI